MRDLIRLAVLLALGAWLAGCSATCVTDSNGIVCGPYLFEL